MSNLIDKQAAIDLWDKYHPTIAVDAMQYDAELRQLPPALREQHHDEWCTDCKEYDKERHCCPRWNKVIRQALADAQPEPCEDAVSRAEILRMINCINDHHAITPYKSVGAVTEHLTRIASSLQPVTPKPIQPEYHEIGYRECADAVLKMWMDNVLTDGEHNRIIDKLNAKWAISEGDA